MELFTGVVLVGLFFMFLYIKESEKQKKRKLLKKTTSSKGTRKKQTTSKERSESVGAKKTAQLQDLRKKLEAAEKKPISRLAIKEMLQRPPLPYETQKPWSPEEVEIYEEMVLTADESQKKENNDLSLKNKDESQKKESASEVVDILIDSIDFDNRPIFEEKNKGYILVVDDSKSVRVILEKLLIGYGYKVITQNDAYAALEFLKGVKDFPSVLITDIEMPKMDGFELIRAIRGSFGKQGENLAVIAMTAHLNLHFEIAAEEHVNGFLPKPFKNQDLLDQLTFLIQE